MWLGSGPEGAGTGYGLEPRDLAPFCLRLPLSPLVPAPGSARVSARVPWSHRLGVLIDPSQRSNLTISLAPAEGLRGENGSPASA